MDISINNIQQKSLTGILLPTKEWEKIFRSWSANELGTTKYSGRLIGEKEIRHEFGTHHVHCCSTHSSSTPTKKMPHQIGLLMWGSPLCVACVRGSSLREIAGDSVWRLVLGRPSLARHWGILHLDWLAQGFPESLFLTLQLMNIHFEHFVPIPCRKFPCKTEFGWSFT